MCADLSSHASCQEALLSSPCGGGGGGGGGWSRSSVRHVVVQRASELEAEFGEKVRVDECPEMVQRGFALQ